MERLTARPLLDSQNPDDLCNILPWRLEPWSSCEKRSPPEQAPLLACSLLSSSPPHRNLPCPEPGEGGAGRSQPCLLPGWSPINLTVFYQCWVCEHWYLSGRQPTPTAPGGMGSDCSALTPGTSARAALAAESRL